MKQDSYATKLGFGTWSLDIPVRTDRSDLEAWKQARESTVAGILSRPDSSATNHEPSGSGETPEK